jgi:hypothetical protein
VGGPATLGLQPAADAVTLKGVMRNEAERLAPPLHEEQVRQGAEQTLAAFTCAVERAITAHLAAGHSVYQLDERGQVLEVRATAR